MATFNPGLFALGLPTPFIEQALERGKEKGKAARHSEDIARQREEVRAILNQYLSQLVLGSEEYNQLVTVGQGLLDRVAEGGFAVPELGGAVLDQQQAATQLGQQLVSQQGARVAEGGPATPQQAATMAREQQLRTTAAPVPFEQDVLNALTGVATTTPSGDVFARTVSRAASPTIDDEVFKRMLDVVVDRVNTESAGRGILGGGLRLEQIGRAGNEVAIAEATRQDALRQEAFRNFGSVFDVGEGLRNRAIGLEGDLVNLQLGRESSLTKLLSERGTLRESDARDLLERQSGQATANRLDVEDAEAARRAAIGQAIGTGLAVAAAPFTGGASLALAPATGQIGSGLAGGGGGGGGNAASLLATQRTQTTPSGTPASVPLSRTPQPIGQLSPEELRQLLSRLNFN